MAGRIERLKAKLSVVKRYAERTGVPDAFREMKNLPPVKRVKVRSGSRKLVKVTKDKSLYVVQPKRKARKHLANYL